jgi:hypothetical protein
MEEFKGDKRTKAYKDWKAKFEKEQETKSEGLGDTVAKIAEATGITKLVKSIYGDDCGCDERKTKLNKFLTYKVVNCLNEDEYTYLKGFIYTIVNRVNAEDKVRLITIFSRVYGTNKYKTTTSCSSCVRDVVNSLKQLIKNYE